MNLLFNIEYTQTLNTFNISGVIKGCWLIKCRGPENRTLIKTIEQPNDVISLFSDRKHFIEVNQTDALITNENFHYFVIG